MNSTFTTLNPSASEYNPIPPGVTPHPNAPPPSFLLPTPPPPPPPPPLFIPIRVLTYIPPTLQLTQQPYYEAISQNPFVGNPPTAPPRHPPPPQRRVSGAPRRRARSGTSFDNIKPERAVDYHRNNAKNCRRGCMQQKEEKKFKVLPIKRDEVKTTVMMKNIPYDCQRGELISLIDSFCSLENGKARSDEGTSEENLSSAYDFLYLPVDFRTKRSRGFAFVNFTNAKTVWKFFEAFHHKDWVFIHQTTLWTKQIEVVTAKIQGKEALVNHFSGSVFECETDEYLPVIFNPARDGSGQSGQMTAIGSRRSTAPRKSRHNHKS